MTQHSFTALRRRVREATALSPLGGGGLAAALLLAPLPALGQDGPRAAAAPAPNPVVPVPGGATKLDYGANGVPVVKIATPDAKGTSYNRYDTFNVDGRGVVLNNSDKIVQSRLAGYIDGNAALKGTGGASLIINEVVSANPSKLAGYIEIAGRAADLILANPYGISCDGCGFVNAPRVTLAAATPQIDAGTVTGFRTGTGTISVNGRGLDATGARLELFARAIQINAGLYADTVTASFGAGDITREGEVVVTGRRNPAAVDQPLFGLDVAALGGMYAKSIRLIGTEAGLGVNVSGELAGLEQGVSLSVDGKVSIEGIFTAKTDAAIETSGALGVAGQLYAEGKTSVRAGGLTAPGLVGSGGDLSITTGTVTSAGTLAAGLTRDGKIAQPGNLTLIAAGEAALSGRALAQGALAITAANLRNAGLASGGTLTLRTATLNNAGGVLDARTALDAQAGAIANSGGAIQSGGTLALTGASLANARGGVLALGDGKLTLGIAGAITGADGQIGGNGDVTVRAGALSIDGAAGSVTAAKALDLGVGGDLSVANKAIVTSGGVATIAVGGTTAIGEGGIQGGSALTLTTGALSVGASGQVSGGAVTIASRGTLTNAGLIASAGRVAVTAGALANSGGIVGDGGLSLGVNGALAQNGTLASDNGITIDAGALTANGGTIQASGSLAITAGAVALERATVLATGSGAFTLDSRGALTLTGTRLGGNGDVRVAGGTIALADTRITALGALTLAANAGDLALGAGSAIENAGDLTLRTAGTLSHASDIVGRGANLTIDAGGIVNTGGAILHLGSGTLALTARGALDNAGGRIGSNGTLALTVGALSNAGGRITGAGAAALTVSGDVNNASGLIASAAGLTLRGGALDNSGGSIETAGRLDARLAALRGGTIVATGTSGQLALDSSGAVSGNAVIGAAGDATIAAGAFALGDDARLTAGGTLTVNARDGDLALGGGTIDAARVALSSARAVLTGNGGLIQATGALAVNAGALVTGGGRVAAGGPLTVRAGTIDNSGGFLLGAGEAVTLTAGTLRNDRGTLGGDGAVAITATTIDNGAGVLAAGGDLTLTATTLGNAAGGQVWADNDAALTVGDTLTNRGAIAANRDLKVTAGALDGGSGAGAGTLAGGRLLRLTSGGGSAGKLVAPNSLTLGFTGDLTNAAGDAISTPGALTLSIGGNFTNAGRVEAGAVGITTGGAIANQAGGSIVGSTVSLTAGTALENQGLINGGAVTLRGAGITNGGAIFGDRMALFGAGGIVNAGENAVIATRGGLLQLSSGGDIVNRDGALLYSSGAIAITGADGAGRAASLQNLSADLQAQGDIAIAAATVRNARAVFAMEEALLSTRVVDEEDRRDREHRTLTDYVETVTETQITADSGAARIIGGNIAIDADRVENALSTISASGNLGVGAAAISNTAFTGYNTTTQNGTIRDQKRNCFLFFCGGWDTRSTTPIDTRNAVATFTVPSTITAGGTLTIDAVTIDNLVLTPGGGTADIFAANASAGAVTAGAAVGAALPGGVTAPGALPGAIAGAAIDPSFGFTVRTPADRASGGAGAATLDLGGLFKYADATSQFLVEADPRFTNYNNFLSSDYFLDRLGYDPARVQRRLGDGLYEQQLIANQLVALVGAQRIVGYGDNQSQYRALLDAGATYAQQYQLALGVGLSPAQMATLTSDIVLLVETTVQTPSGPVTVLAPRVYLTKAAQADLTSGGAIIAGRDLQLRASDSLANAGVLRASASSTIVGGTISNAGRLDLGSRGVVAATQDLIDRGGAITGGNLTLSAGRDLRLEPVVTTRSVATRYYAGRSDQQVALTTTTTNRGTDLAATGNVDLLAGRSLSVTGAMVAAGGNLALYGGQVVTIASATDRGSAFAIGREGKAQFKQTQTESRNVLSDLRAGGDVTVATPGALTVNGGTVAAGGALVADAGSIAVSGVVDETRLQRETLKKSGGFLSSTKTTTKYDATDQSVVASTLAGDTVALRSQGDTRIAGSNVVAGNGVGIVAGGAIDVNTVTATDTEAQSTRVKKGGLSIGGGGLFVGVAKTQNDVNTVATINTGSLIGSTAGDVTLDAGRDLTVTGSQVVGTGRTTLTGERVTVQNATDVTRTDTLSKSSSVGLSVGVQNPVLSGLVGVRDSARILGNDNTNARTAAVAGLAGGLAAYNAADALSMGGANVADTARNLTSVGVSFGVSSSKATSTTVDESNVASRIAGQDVALVARGAGANSTITVQGSEVAAERNLILAAPGAITLRSADETDTLTSSNKSSAFSVGVQFGLAGGITPSASLSLGKGSASGTDVRYAESVLTAGNQVTITTPGALTLQGALVSGERVAIDAGRLAIISQQDRSSFAERQRNIGISVSAANGGSIGGNLTNARQNGEFASVREQSGIYAGAGGYAINVAGNTNLVGGVIASEAEAARNRLTTGTLTATDLANTERYRASSTSFGGGIGGIGKDNNGLATAGTDRTPGSDLPGIRTGIGTISATPPVALSAKGSQSGTTYSAIAQGTIDITSGDAASRAVAATINRDTAGANAGALTQEYNAAKREEIALGFAAATQLANQTGTFFANRAQEEAALRRQAETGLGVDGMPLTLEQRAHAQADADRLKSAYGSGSAARIMATALNGAAGGNVTGSFNSFVQASAVNVLQSLTVSQIKTLADGLGARNPDGSPRTNLDGSVVQTAQSEALRGVLQGLAGCAGAAAGGLGSCGSAAIGASASVALNLLLNGADRDDPRDQVLRYDADGRPINQSTLAQQEARSSLVATIVGAIAAGAGLDANATVNAAQIETENNQLSVAGRINRASFVTNPTAAQLAQISKDWEGYFSAGDGALVLQAAGGDAELAKRCLASTGAGGCGDVQRRLDGLRANYAGDTIVALSGGSLDSQRALGQLNYAQLSQLNEYKAALDALSPAARAALVESLRSRGGNDAGANILAFLVSPTTAVNLAANLALLEQSNVGRTVAALAAFDAALKQGFVDQGKDTVVALASLVGKTVRLGVDTSLAGDAGDVLRTVYREQFGTDVPAGVAALLPSGLRGDQNVAYLRGMSAALADYASTRAQDPAKFAADVRFVVNKYKDELGAAYAKAEAEGTLPQFYGEIAGRVAFEMATIILPTKAAYAARAGTAVEGLAGTARAVDEAVELAAAARAAEDARAVNQAAVNALSPGNAQVTVNNGVPVSAADLKAPFTTLGTNQLVGETAVGQQMIATIQAASPGMSYERAETIAQGYFASGVAVPVATPIPAGTMLVKIVPKGVEVSPYSGYFMTMAEYNAVKGNPAALTEVLGLPLGSKASAYDVYEITARRETTVFSSQIARTQQGSLSQPGGATQTMVLDRGQFTAPKKVTNPPAGGK